MSPAHLSGLVEALERGGSTHTVEDVLRQVEAGEAKLWVRGAALIVTEIHQTPQVKVLHFWLATGSLDEVVALSREVLEWGRAQGCEQATLAGRRGWERVLASEGWAPMLTLMGRVL